jgi:hypothetical protein
MSMNTEKKPSTPQHELHRRQIPAGEARCAVFRRTYDAPIEDVWDACTNPKRLSRWYAPVAGDLHVGGAFTQGDFGPGKVVRCEVGGQIFDAVYRMGGGYGPRLVTLDQHLRGELPDDVDPSLLHLRDDLRPAIEQSMAALAELLDADVRR